MFALFCVALALADPTSPPEGAPPESPPSESPPAEDTADPTLVPSPAFVPMFPAGPLPGDDWRRGRKAAVIAAAVSGVGVTIGFLGVVLPALGEGQPPPGYFLAGSGLALIGAQGAYSFTSMKASSALKQAGCPVSTTAGVASLVAYGLELGTLGVGILMEEPMIGGLSGLGIVFGSGLAIAQQTYDEEAIAKCQGTSRMSRRSFWLVPQIGPTSGLGLVAQF